MICLATSLECLSLRPQLQSQTDESLLAIKDPNEPHPIISALSLAMIIQNKLIIKKINILLFNILNSDQIDNQFIL